LCLILKDVAEIFQTMAQETVTHENVEASEEDIQVLEGMEILVLILLYYYPGTVI